MVKITNANHPDTVVLNIPKSGTSLKNILELIIKSLPNSEQQQFLNKLNEGGTQLTTKEAKVSKFLNELSLAIQFGNQPIHLQDLSQVLPALLIDPSLRN